ncbi:MAG: hypothetical protein Q7T26_11385 [Dehalococcoidia bacterium]|nr:hypothetical protein [Dehalococcoidia bacterium]
MAALRIGFCGRAIACRINTPTNGPTNHQYRRNFARDATSVVTVRAS